MRKIFSLFIASLLLISVSGSIFAQETPPLSPSDTTPSTDPTFKINGLAVNDNPDLLFDMYDHPDTRIDGNTRLVWITFSNLEKGRSYYVCPYTDQKTCVLLAKLPEFKADSDGNIVIKVCGDGNETLKGVQVAKYLDEPQSSGGGKIHEDCKKSRDYFHEGHSYRLILYTEEKVNNRQGSDILSAEFFVAHSYPLVKVNSASPTTQPVAVTLWGRRPGGDSANNYQVVVEGTDNGYKNSTCYTIPEKDWWTNNLTVGVNTQFDGKENKVIPEFILNGTGFDINSPRDASLYGKTNYFGRAGDKDKGALGRGTYVAKINERVNDERPLGLGKHCEGGLTYMHVFFQVTSNGIKIINVMYDPNNSDRDEIEKQENIPQIPCAKGAFDQDTKTCKAFDVALLGTIPLDPLSFIKSAYTLVLSVAGIAAIAIILRSGYKFMYSRGDKEAINDARARLTSAIIGLAFIIFAYVILSIIGVDILKIPGFG